MARICAREPVLKLLALSTLTWGACTATAPAVRDDQRGVVSPQHGVIIGKLGVPPYEDVGAMSRELRLVEMTTGKNWVLSFVESLTDDDGRTAPFFANLPAGKYRLVSWKISFLPGPFEQESDSLELEVAPGRVVCVGALYPIKVSRGRVVSGQRGQFYRVLLLPRDECAQLERTFHARAPGFTAPVVTNLAMDRRCPDCRAEIQRFERDSLPSGLFMAVHVTVFEGEQRRLDGAPRFAMRWPAEAGSEPRSILLRICASAEGAVADVAVMESAHPVLDPQVTATAKTWKIPAVRARRRSQALLLRRALPPAPSVRTL